MPEVINVTITASAKSGPELKGAWQVSVPTYEKLQLEVESKKKKKLTLASGKQIQLLVIGAGPGDGQVNYTVNGAAPAVELKELPQVVLYRAGMLPSTDQIDLEFENTGGKTVTVDALVGRTLV